MEDRNYAKIEWAIDDVVENAKELEIQITKDTARKVLATKERRIMDAMVVAGWQVIEDALCS